MNYLELKVEVTPPSQEAMEILIAQLAEMGFEGFIEGADGFSAYINEKEFADTLRERINEMVVPEGVGFKWGLSRVEDRDWNQLWESNFEPIIVDSRCLVRASFHKGNPDIDYEIVIDPKMAFGTGHHQTTHMMIEAILNDDYSGKAVLDMGCGTGVLAILAEMKGAAHVLAVDVDEWAYRNALENISTNGCSRTEVVQGDSGCIAGKRFDVILANINLNILMADLPVYANCLVMGGKLLMSGILTRDVEELTGKARSLGLEPLETMQMDGWALAAFTK
jgi:ribosomal protein L11 methyltransferase